jgi:lipid A 3-O-deacylase
MMKSGAAIIILAYALNGNAQQIDHTAIYRNIASEKYVRLHYENDYFSKADIYYSQGISLEVVHPNLKAIPLTYLLPARQLPDNKFGIAVEHLGFTPTSISHAEIIKGDRPFSSCLILKSFLTHSNFNRLARLSSGVGIGVIGPVAGGKEIQQSIHKWIRDEPPLGWNNQIKNDLILNYCVDVEKGIYAYQNHFLATCKAGGQFGTFRDKLFGTVSFMGGIFDNPFSSRDAQPKKFQAYIFFEQQMQAIAYDATLQGGLINRTSPYVLSSSEVKRIVFQNHLGVTIRFKRVTIEYFQSYITSEFRAGHDHHWGGIRLGTSL